MERNNGLALSESLNIKVNATLLPHDLECFERKDGNNIIREKFYSFFFLGKLTPFILYFNSKNILFLFFKLNT